MVTGGSGEKTAVIVTLKVGVMNVELSEVSSIPIPLGLHVTKPFPASGTAVIATGILSVSTISCTAGLVDPLPEIITVSVLSSSSSIAVTSRIMMLSSPAVCRMRITADPFMVSASSSAASNIRSLFVSQFSLFSDN